MLLHHRIPFTIAYTSPPGHEAVLTIRFSENEETGYFYRTVDIFGNIEPELSIEISGMLHIH